MTFGRPFNVDQQANKKRQMNIIARCGLFIVSLKCALFTEVSLVS